MAKVSKLLYILRPPVVLRIPPETIRLNLSSLTLRSPVLLLFIRNGDRQRT